ncbi:MAG: class I SAM-dependent methyltransferase [Proteobacteria bacterium]|nr:class I SAM-dependent methyltransferase [Pseudomonadota bacterium]
MTPISEDWYSELKGWSEEDFGKPGLDESTYCDAEFSPYLANRKARVLELGFGNGGVLGWCRSRGHDCAGIESNPLLMARASKAGFDTAASLAEARSRYGDHSFDLVVALDVLEHIPAPDLLGMLNDIHALLKPGAILVARFPNGDSPFGRAYQYGDITHVTVLGSGKVASLATRANFSVACFKEPAVPLRGAGIVRICKRLSAKAWRLFLGSLISHAYFTGGIRVLSANMVAILRSQPTMPLDDNPIAPDVSDQSMRGMPR